MTGHAESVHNTFGEAAETARQWAAEYAMARLQGHTYKLITEHVNLADLLATIEPLGATPPDSNRLRLVIGKRRRLPWPLHDDDIGRLRQQRLRYQGIQDIRNCRCLLIVRRQPDGATSLHTQYWAGPTNPTRWYPAVSM